jgi:hypothetical protein
MTKRFTPDQVLLQHWCNGPMFVADTPTARANKVALEAHFLAEWNDDIDATMATIHPDNPWQRIPALGVEVVGFQAVRDYYLARFSTWPGPVMEHFDRVSVTDHAIFVEGRLKPQPGRQINALAGPCVVVIDLREGLVMGETVYGAPSRA